MASPCFVVVLVLLAALPSSDQCGPGSNFPSARVLETETEGYVLMNVTEEAGVTWSISLKEDPSYVEGSELYQWLDAAIFVDTMPVSGYHFFQLNYTLDLEFVFDRWALRLSVLSYNVKCHVAGNPDVSYEWFLEVQAVNEFAPDFIDAPFNISLPEDTELQTVVIRLRDNAIDRDVVTSSPSDIHEFNMVTIPLNWTQNTTDLFSMVDKQNGEVKVAQVLDFESFPGPDEAYVEFSITVWDLSRWNTTSTLSISIVDVDDQPPFFFYPGCGPYPCEVVYTCEVPSAFTGVVTSMNPANITARDGDTLDYNVTYRIKSVTGLPSADFSQFVAIDSDTGEFSILQLQGVATSQVFVIIQATEVSAKALSKDCTLIVRVIHPEQTTTTQNGTTQALNPGFSTEGESSGNMVVAVVVLAIFVLFALIGVVILVLYIKKRSDKPIYPASDLKDIEEEEEDKGDKRGMSGSRTDSGQWSMSGLPSPGPHAGSSAPAHTRLTPLGSQSNGYVANGYTSGHHRKVQSARISHIAVTEESGGEEGTADNTSEPDTQTDNGVVLDESLTSPDLAPTPSEFKTYSPMVYAQAFRNDDVVEVGSHVTHEAEVASMENGGPPTSQARRLPPLHPPPLANMATPKRQRPSRKQRKEQMQAKLREEVYDGTKTFPMGADDSFFKDGNKQKVKMSTRRKKRAQTPSQLLIVNNDYTEV